MSWRVVQGSAVDGLPTLADGSVQCVVTSPPYFGLRDYGTPGQIGLEPTPQAYVAALVAVFAQVWRVVRDEGRCWLNVGESYGGIAGNTRGDVAGGGKERDEMLFGSIRAFKQGTR